MSTARKILDLHGQGTEELARELATLPHGRYVLLPENELDEDDALSPEDEAAIEEGLADIDRGEVVEAAEVFAAARARLEP
jgi:predicted transcriptional regulator